MLPALCTPDDQEPSELALPRCIRASECVKPVSCVKYSVEVGAQNRPGRIPGLAPQHLLHSAAAQISHLTRALLWGILPQKHGFGEGRLPIPDIIIKDKVC